MAARSRPRRSKRLRQKANKSAPTRSYNTRQNASLATESPARNQGNRTAAKSAQRGKRKREAKKAISAVCPRASKTRDAEKKLDRRKKTLESGHSNQRINSEKRSRSKSPSRYEKREKIVQDLRRRVQSIPFDNRPVPNTNNMNALARELKLRLATRCLAFHETGRRGGKVKVTTVPQRERRVPMWAITRDQDPVLVGEEKVVVSKWKSLARKGG